MNRICPLDGSTMGVLGTTKIPEHLKVSKSGYIVGYIVVVRRCPHCGEVTFWDDYEDIVKDKKQQKLKAML